MRLEGLHSFTVQGVAHDLRGVAQVLCIKIAGLVEHFGMAQPDRGSRRPADLETDPPDHVLAKVENRLTSGCVKNPNRLELVHPTHGGTHRGD